MQFPKHLWEMTGMCGNVLLATHWRALYHFFTFAAVALSLEWPRLPIYNWHLYSLLETRYSASSCQRHPRLLIRYFFHSQKTFSSIFCLFTWVKNFRSNLIDFLGQQSAVAKCLDSLYWPTGGERLPGANESFMQRAADSSQFQSTEVNYPYWLLFNRVFHSNSSPSTWNVQIKSKQSAPLTPKIRRAVIDYVSTKYLSFSVHLKFIKS